MFLHVPITLSHLHWCRSCPSKKSSPMFENLLAYSPNTLQKCTSIFNQNKILEIQIGRSGLKNISRYCPFKAGGGGGGGWPVARVTLRGTAAGRDQYLICSIMGEGLDIFGHCISWGCGSICTWNLLVRPGPFTPLLPLHTFSPFTYSPPMDIWVKDTVRRSYSKHNNNIM